MLFSKQCCCIALISNYCLIGPHEIPQRKQTHRIETINALFARKLITRGSELGESIPKVSDVKKVIKIAYNIQHCY